MTWLLWPLAVGWVGYALLGRRWRIAPRLRSAPVLAGAAVVAVVPARNEAAELPQTLGPLLGQRHPVRVVLVDDHSEDGTADVARGGGRRRGDRSSHCARLGAPAARLDGEGL